MACKAKEYRNHSYDLQLHALSGKGPLWSQQWPLQMVLWSWQSFHQCPQSRKSLSFSEVWSKTVHLTVHDWHLTAPHIHWEEKKTFTRLCLNLQTRKSQKVKTPFNNSITFAHYGPLDLSFYVLALHHTLLVWSSKSLLPNDLHAYIRHNYLYFSITDRIWTTWKYRWIR